MQKVSDTVLSAT